MNSILPGLVTDEMAKKELFSPSAGLRFILPNGKFFEMYERDKVKGKNEFSPLFFVSKRSDFDNLLVTKLSSPVTNIHFGTHIKTIEKHPEGWKLYGTKNSSNIEIETEMLVAADGAHSVVLRSVGDVKIDRKNYAGAVRQYWKGVEGIHPDKLIEIYFPKSLPLSYFWIFPLPDGLANVGYGMSSDYIARKNINVRKAFEELIKTDSFLAPRFRNAKPEETIKGWGLPMSGSNRKAYGKGRLLVGDAASIICPTTGEGIGSGMISGYIAAHFLQRAYNSKCFDEQMFVNYNREIHKRLKKDEKLYRILNTLPAWAFKAVVNSVISNRFLQSRIVKKEIPKWIVKQLTQNQ